MKHRLILTSILATIGPEQANGLQDVTIYLGGIRLIVGVPAVKGAFGNVRLLIEFEEKFDAKI
jgi:hypothetical protein